MRTIQLIILFNCKKIPGQMRGDDQQTIWFCVCDFPTRERLSNKRGIKSAPTQRAIKLIGEAEIGARAEVNWVPFLPPPPPPLHPSHHTVGAIYP